MTDLKKPVRRRTMGLHRGRRIMVSLEPGDVLALRQERCRQTEYVSIATIYDYACSVRALAHVAGLTYAAAEALAADAGREPGQRFSAKRLIAESKEQGIAFRKLRMGSRTVRRFIREHPTGRYYLRKRGHSFAVIDGEVSDHTKPGAMVLDAWRCELAHDLAF